MGTILKETASYDDVVNPNPGEGVRAGGGVNTPILIDGPDFNGGIIYEASLVGVRVRHLGGISMTLGVTVAGNDVTVQLGTDGTGVVTSTAQNVIDKINMSAAALALLIAYLPVGSTGAGLAGVRDYVQLAAGKVGSVRPPFQALVNRVKWVRDKFYSFINGLISAKKIVVDNVGDQDTFPGEYLTVTKTGISATNVGSSATSGNPPQTTALRNDLRPIGFVKAWGWVQTNAGVVAFQQGMNCTFSVFSASKIEVTFGAGMIGTSYCAVANVISGNEPYIPLPEPFDGFRIRIGAKKHDGTLADFSSGVFNITVIVCGLQ